MTCARISRKIFHKNIAFTSFAKKERPKEGGC
jgi:hypothetical protein